MQKKAEEIYLEVVCNNHEIVHVLNQVVDVAEHQWWETLLGWSPTATGELNMALHPVIVIMMGQICLGLMTVVTVIWMCIMKNKLMYIYRVIQLTGLKREIIDILNDDFLRKPDGNEDDDNYVSMHGVEVIKDEEVRSTYENL